MTGLPETNRGETMPLNDDPNAWPDEYYEEVVTEIREGAGDSGLHTIPDDVLAAALAKIEEDES